MQHMQLIVYAEFSSYALAPSAIFAQPALAVHDTHAAFAAHAAHATHAAHSQCRISQLCFGS